MTENKPVHARPSLYGFYFEVIKEIGLKYGYNIVLHGSMNRDLDLIAIPWDKYVGSKFEMLDEIAETIGGDILTETDEQRQLLQSKSHGRECYVININRTIKTKYDGMATEFITHKDPQYYIDISILPSEGQQIPGVEDIKIKGALNASVTAIYFSDSSDYRRLHYEVIRILTGAKTENDIDIVNLFNELNKTK